MTREDAIASLLLDSHIRAYPRIIGWVTLLWKETSNPVLAAVRLDIAAQCARNFIDNDAEDAFRSPWVVEGTILEGMLAEGDDA
jgi:hypothetical protein